MPRPKYKNDTTTAAMTSADATVSMPGVKLVVRMRKRDEGCGTAVIP